MAKKDKKSRSLTIVIVIILALWSVMIWAYLTKTGVRRVSIGDIRRSISLKPETTWDEERWVGIYMGRNKIGYGFSRVRKVGEKLNLWSKTKIKLKLLDTVQEINLDIRGILDSDYSIREFEFEALSGFMEIKAEGRREGNDLLVKITTAGEVIEQRIHFDKPPTMEMQWMLKELMKDIKPGETIEFSIFEPMTQREMPVRVSVIGEEDVELASGIIPCWKVEITMAGQSEWAWVSRESSEVVKEHHPGTGMTTILEDREMALDVDWEKAEGVDFITALMVPANTSLIDPRAIVYLKGRLVEAPLSGLDLELAGRQTITGNTIEVKMEEAIPAFGYSLPIGQSLPQKAAEYSEWLASTPFIQSDHRKIKEAAEKAIGKATDAVTATDMLLAWLDKEIEPSLVVSIPSSLEVLEKRRGACKEHTYLFIAMARALGIPARTVSGIVYSDQQMIDGFYYHAWAEVFLADPAGNGLWVVVDPTFNQNPADATHIRLKEGDLDQMIDLMQVIGKLKVHVEEYR